MHATLQTFHEFNFSIKRDIPRYHLCQHTGQSFLNNRSSCSPTQKLINRLLQFRALSEQLRIKISLSRFRLQLFYRKRSVDKQGQVNSTVNLHIFFCKKLKHTLMQCIFRQIQVTAPCYQTTAILIHSVTILYSMFYVYILQQ